MADRACDRAVLIAALIALTATLALAQHVSAPPGLYPSGFRGDAWQGELTGFDPIQQRLTLTAWKCTRAQEFDGFLTAERGGPIEGQEALSGITSIWSVELGSGGKFLLKTGNHVAPMSDVPIGASLVVMYIANKVNGVDRNEVFRIGFLAERNGLRSFVGELQNVSSQDGALTFSRTNQQVWRGYLNPGYYVRGRDGRSYRLQPGEIPLARPFRVIYRTEKCQLPGASRAEKVNWVVQLRAVKPARH